MDQPIENVATVDDVQGAISSVERYFEAVSLTQADETRLADALAPLQTPGPHDPETVEAAFRAYASVAAEVAQRLHDRVAALYAPTLNAFPLRSLAWKLRWLDLPRGCRLFVPSRNARFWLEPSVGVYELNLPLTPQHNQTALGGTAKYDSDLSQGKLRAEVQVAGGQISGGRCGLGILFQPTLGGPVRLRPYLKFFRTGFAEALAGAQGHFGYAENTMRLILHCQRQLPGNIWTPLPDKVAWEKTTGTSGPSRADLLVPLTELTPEFLLLGTEPGTLYQFWVILEMGAQAGVSGPGVSSGTSCSANAECVVSFIDVCEIVAEATPALHEAPQTADFPR